MFHHMTSCSLRRTAAAVTVLSIIALAGCAGSGRSEDDPPGAERRYVTDERPMSSIELIDAAVTSGMLDYSTGLLYKVYVMFSPEDLPADYASDVPAKCGTPLILEVQRNWNMLTPDDRAEISQYVQPLDGPGDDETQLDDVTPGRLDHDRDDLN